VYEIDKIDKRDRDDYDEDDRVCLHGNNAKE